MSNTIQITEDVFGVMPVTEGEFAGQPVRRFTVVNGNGMKVQLITYGAAITSLQVTGGNGVVRDVVLGYDDLNGYLGAYGKNPYFGAIIGRVANRTAKGKFSLNGNSYHLSINNGENHLHGGDRGYDKRLWEAQVIGTKLIFSYLDRDGQEGYPGDVLANVTYELTPDNKLLIKYLATTTQPTPICLTNHAHFNLAGHDKADQRLVGHTLQLQADKYTPLDASLIVTGELKNVQGTLYDLRTPKDLNAMLNQFPKGPYGYDINFCINPNPSGSSFLRFVGRLAHPESKLALEVHSDQPGVQVYSGNFFPDPDNNESPIPGKNGAKYFKHGGCALETQNYPNAVNMPNFPNAVLQPGEVYNHNLSLQFLKLA